MPNWLTRSALILGLLLATGGASAGEAPLVQEAGYRDILAARTEALLIFRYSANPDIMVMDIPTLAQQGEMFNRMVALIERMGASRVKVMNNDELAEYVRSVGKTAATFAFGNDFRSSEMVIFFNLAAHGQVELNEQEQLLRRFLLDQRMVMEKFGFLQVAGHDRIILSVPQEQAQTLDNGNTLRITARARDTILRHELSHGEYYTNRYYADYCRQFWRTVMSAQERAAFRKFLAGRNYDTDNDEMMINETQAYLIHTPDPGAFSPQAAGLAPAAIDGLRQKFMAGNPPSPLFADVSR
ncbi:conserved exported hypothetical protein [Candidatus Terasakiella magnetica]|nr:conserved exported hypothetical protein [Candidatus Terasakiella magnetica]